MDVIRNDKKIGYNKYFFTAENNFFIVKNEINFVAKIIGINLLSINGSSTETYRNKKLVKYQSRTIQNKKNKYNDLILDEKDKVYKINGSSFELHHLTL